MITFDNVSKKYGNNHTAVKALNVEIKKGEFLLLSVQADVAKLHY